MVEAAPTGRAKCRGCGQRLESGVLRFGERLPNPFGEGEATHWFHLECAAFKRPEPVLELLQAGTPVPDELARLRAVAEEGLAHHRLPRLDGAERDPSGRARCRACHAAIDKGAWRLKLAFWEEGRFSPAGFLHAACARAYLEVAQATDLAPRLRRFSPGLGEAELALVVAALDAAPPPPAS